MPRLISFRLLALPIGDMTLPSMLSIAELGFAGGKVKSNTLASRLGFPLAMPTAATPAPALTPSLLVGDAREEMVEVEVAVDAEPPLAPTAEEEREEEERDELEPGAGVKRLFPSAAASAASRCESWLGNSVASV